VASKNRSSKSKKNRKLSQSTDVAASAAASANPKKGTLPASSKNVTLAWLGFILVLLTCMTWVLTHAYLVDTVTVRLCEKMDAGIPEEKRMPVFLSEIAFDGYVWNRHAEHLGENGTWRLRSTDLDNAPDGREVHWNSAFAWYLRALGEIYRAIQGDSLRNSIFRMSIWANPILLILALGIFSTLSARRFGPLCGTVIAIGMVAVPTFYEGFMPAYPDHHGIIAFALMGLLFGIAWAGAGWVQGSQGTDFVPPHSLRQAKHGMIFSAICGAAGLWISALSTAIVLGAVGLAALIAAGISRWIQRKDDCLYHPELWKTWAIWGAGTSFGLYLLEYFPFHLSMRLEVNHPLYSLGWIGGGWIVAEVSGWLNRSATKPEVFPWKKLIWPAVLCVLLPIAVLTGGNEVYSARDPFMVRLYKNIAELLPLFKRIALGGLTWQVAFGWFPLLLLVAIIMNLSRRVGHGTKSALLFLVIPILIITGLQIYQVRWGMLAGPLYIALAGIVIPQFWRLVPPEPIPRGFAAVALLAFAFLLVKPSFDNSMRTAWTQFRAGDNVPITPGQGLALLHRKMARTILDNDNGKPVVLLSSPNSSCILSCIGGFRTVGTLYWENVDGLKKAAAALNAQSDAEALEWIQKLGVTHISMMTWENFIQPFFGILYPERVPGKTFDASFGKKALFDRVIPPWSRPLVFPPNDLSKGLQQQILMLQVVPNQTLPEAKFHLARFVQHVEGNPVQAEITYKDLLDENPENATVRVELIKLYLSQRRFEEVVQQTLLSLKSLNPASQSQLVGDVSSALTAAGQQEIAERIQKEAGKGN
jgi:hypothetical protein